MREKITSPPAVLHNVRLTFEGLGYEIPADHNYELRWFLIMKNSSFDYEGWQLTAIFDI